MIQFGTAEMQWKEVEQMPPETLTVGDRTSTSELVNVDSFTLYRNMKVSCSVHKFPLSNGKL